MLGGNGNLTTSTSNGGSSGSGSFAAGGGGGGGGAPPLDWGLLVELAAQGRFGRKLPLHEQVG